MEHATRGRVAWSLLVLMPTALMSGYGFTFGLASRAGTRSETFSVMAKYIPTVVWGVAWFTIGVCCLVGAIAGSWQWLRTAMVGAWALSTGMLFSVAWARFVNEVPVSMVGISWAYFLWAACGFSAMFGHISKERRETNE
mgnify:CR=1 FL=1